MTTDRSEERCAHENAEESADGRGLALRCPDCGAEGWDSYAAIYGVSNADFI